MSGGGASSEPLAQGGGGAFSGGSFVIAIDGPSGTGKSTVSRRVAQILHAGYLDTGAQYRMVALHVLDRGIDPHDVAAVADALPDLRVDAPTDPESQRHVLAGRDVTARIRDADVTEAVSPVSANPAVRQFLLHCQRRAARSGRMVVEGRDIGTVIAPDAPLKIYLTADAAERARRRFRQTVPTGAHAGGGVAPGDTAYVDADRLAEVARELERRDQHDSNRRHAPLQAAPDAVVIDSSTLGVDETVAAILDLAAARGIS